MSTLRCTLLVIMTVTFISGCNDTDSGQVADTTAPPTSAAAPPPPAPPAAPNVSGAMKSVAQETAAADSSRTNQPAASEAAPAESEFEREKADVGVGKRGRNYGGGIITTPVRSYFRVRQRAVFQIQLPQAERMYQAEHDGKGPPSHEEYMRDIIEANGIALPELPEGETYFYDAEKGELMVQRAKG